MRIPRKAGVIFVNAYPMVTPFTQPRTNWPLGTVPALAHQEECHCFCSRRVRTRSLMETSFRGQTPPRFRYNMSSFLRFPATRPSFEARQMTKIIRKHLYITRGRHCLQGEWMLGVWARGRGLKRERPDLGVSLVRRRFSRKLLGWHRLEKAWKLG